LNAKFEEKDPVVKEMNEFVVNNYPLMKKFLMNLITVQVRIE
jgi:hypothetical protein